MQSNIIPKSNADQVSNYSDKNPILEDNRRHNLPLNQPDIASSSTSKKIASPITPTDIGTTAQALIDQGSQLWQQGKLDEAITTFQQATESDINAYKAHHFIACIFAKQGKLEAAVTAYQKALKINPDYHHSHHGLGQVLSWQGKVSEAIAATRKAIAIEPAEASFHYQLGRYLESQGNNEQAITAYREAIKIKPDLAIANEALENLLENKNEIVDSSANTDISGTNSQQISSSNQQAISSSSASQKIENTTTETDIDSTAQTLINQGKKLWQQGELDDAIATFQQAIDSDINAYKAHHFIGCILSKQSKLEAAVAAYKKALEINPNYHWSSHSLGQVLSWQGKVSEAIAATRKAIAIEPAEASFHYQLGRYLESQGNSEQAIAAYREAIKINPDLTIASTALENLVKEQNNVLGASDPISNEKLVIPDQDSELQPTTQTLINQGNEFWQDGLLDEAISTFKKATDLDPSAYKAHHFIGCILAKQGKLEAAVAAYKKSLGINTSYPWSYHALGQVLFWQEKMNEAISAARRAIEIEPKEASFYHLLGKCLEHQGNIEEAIAAYREAIKINPDLTIVRTALEILVNNQKDILESSEIKEKKQDIFEGCLEVIDGCLLKGWAWNCSNPDQTLALVIYKDDDELLRFQANRFREDLKQAGIGTGNYGFAIRLPIEVCRQAPFKLKILVANSNYILQNSSIEFNYNETYKSSFQGFCEPITEYGQLKGWALDNDNLDNKLTLYVYDNYNFVCKLKASLYRKELHEWKKGDGFYSYWSELPAVFLDNNEHQLSICWGNSAVELHNSPIIIEKDFILKCLLKRARKNLNNLVNLTNN